MRVYPAVAGDGGWAETDGRAIMVVAGRRPAAGVPGGKDTAVIASPVEILLAQVRQLAGFALACVMDAATGMVLGSVQDQDDLELPVVAAGATGIATVLGLMTAELATGGDLDDVIVSFSDQFHVIRPLRTEHGQQLLLLVILRRPSASLGLARQDIRDYVVGLA